MKIKTILLIISAILTNLSLNASIWSNILNSDQLSDLAYENSNYIEALEMDLEAINNSKFLGCHKIGDKWYNRGNITAAIEMDLACVKNNALFSNENYISDKWYERNFMNYSIDLDINRIKKDHNNINPIFSKWAERKELHIFLYKLMEKYYKETLEYGVGRIIKEKTIRILTITIIGSISAYSYIPEFRYLIRKLLANKSPDQVLKILLAIENYFMSKITSDIYTLMDLADSDLAIRILNILHEPRFNKITDSHVYNLIQSLHDTNKNQIYQLLEGKLPNVLTDIITQYY